MIYNQINLFFPPIIMNRNYANKQAIRFRFGEQCQINTVYLLIYIFTKLLAKHDYMQKPSYANFIDTIIKANTDIHTNQRYTFYTKKTKNYKQISQLKSAL